MRGVCSVAGTWYVVEALTGRGHPRLRTVSERRALHGTVGIRIITRRSV